MEGDDDGTGGGVGIAEIIISGLGGENEDLMIATITEIATTVPPIIKSFAKEKGFLFGNLLTLR